MSAINIFVSYSHEDARWVQPGEFGLIPWLAHQLEEDDVQCWVDYELKKAPGIAFQKKIEAEIDQAQFAVLLISNDFVSSRFIRDVELKRIRERVEGNEMSIIPILVGPTSWRGRDDVQWLSERQMMPGRPTPLIDYTESPIKWQHVRNEILEAMQYRIDEQRKLRASYEANPKEEPNNLLSGTTASVSTGEIVVPPELPPDAPVIFPAAAETKTKPSSAMPGWEQKMAAFSSFTEDLGKGVKLEMVRVPGGTFMMGSPKSAEEHAEREMPQHQVTVSTFAIGKYEVTQAQWKAVMGNNPSHFKGDDLPVEFVSWHDAKEFCAKLKERSGKDYRLPSEAEWEYACRAGTTGDYAGELHELAWYGNNSGLKTHPAGRKKPNPFGLYDMHGNVWEWCEDVWHENYAGAPQDGSAWMEGGNQDRHVLRGGSWGSLSNYCRSAFRNFDGPGVRYYLYFGFRVVVAARTK